MPEGQLCMDVCAVDATSLSLGWCWCPGGASAILPYSQLPVPLQLSKPFGIRVLYSFVIPSDGQLIGCMSSVPEQTETLILQRKNSPEIRNSISTFLALGGASTSKRALLSCSSSLVGPGCQRVKHAKDIPSEQICRGRLQHTFQELHRCACGMGAKWEDNRITQFHSGNKVRLMSTERFRFWTNPELKHNFCGWGMSLPVLVCPHVPKPHFKML